MGSFFSAEAPAEDPLLPDLRTVAAAPAGRPKVDLTETVRHAVQRQAWFIEYLQELGAAPLPFVGCFTAAASPVQVARDIRQVLGVDVEHGQRPWDVYYRQLLEAAEYVSVLVMRLGIVGNKTHRKLDVGEYRDFGISHPLAPVVFINSSDAPSVRLFTLLHELAHIWLGSSGISSVAPGSTRREEIACNAVAGEFHAPSDLFVQLWATASQGLATRIEELDQRFHVSRYVVVHRALDLGLVDRDT
ncbi:MAG: ImmA/IrrE family metallo-endopeptidase [Aquincola sp.]|nr:ImmA/IrrE family metallo-endopeptidase [Aquincola sp.]